jgi:hypothetical protein
MTVRKQEHTANTRKESIRTQAIRKPSTPGLSGNGIPKARKKTDFTTANKKTLLLLSAHHDRERLTSLLLDPLDRPLIPLHAIQPINISIQLWIISLVDNLQSFLSSLQRERHQDVSGSEVFAAEETSTIRCASELGFQESEVGLEVWGEVHDVDSADDDPCDWADEEGDFVTLEDCERG